MQNVITNFGKGRADLTNLPRKINICISPTRDDFPHTHINDLGFQAVRNADGEVVFNVEVGGYFSIKRNVTSIPLGISVTKDQVRLPLHPCPLHPLHPLHPCPPIRHRSLPTARAHPSDQCTQLITDEPIPKPRICFLWLAMTEAYKTNTARCGFDHSPASSPAPQAINQRTPPLAHACLAARGLLHGSLRRMPRRRPGG